LIHFRHVIWEELWRPDVRSMPDHGFNKLRWHRPEQLRETPQSGTGGGESRQTAVGIEKALGLRGVVPRRLNLRFLDHHLP
jgi:hypothetical protein